jgi:SAM-dependent methyltransferase
MAPAGPVSSDGCALEQRLLEVWVESRIHPNWSPMSAHPLAFDSDWCASASLRLREGRLVDSEFDDIYPPSVRAISSSYWTPIAVAMRAARLLVSRTSTRVLDVGSGAGKFCIVGAAATGASFTGIEHRAHLVQTACAAAARLSVEDARFLHGTFDTVDIATFDAVYFYNPFEENVWGRDHHVDDSVKLSHQRFIADIGGAERLLAGARVGTRVVTYHGFGGEMPPGYVRVLQEHCHSGSLEFWIKVATGCWPRRSFMT